MSDRFRELLKKVGSGTHTSKDLTRQEAAAATDMMLSGEATPAQIGAFLMSHRIKRPTGEELAGMLDTYRAWGQMLQPLPDSEVPVTVLGCPYDGRSRTAPVTPITALILAAAGIPVLRHGGDVMPTKYGVPEVEIWQGLGVDWTGLSIEQVQQVFEAAGLGFVYLPQHFPAAAALVPYRDQLGKRPPIATLELIWSPYAGLPHVVAGFVHPPTEGMLRTALELAGDRCFTMVKGLEGSCDLSRDRTAIIGICGSPKDRCNPTAWQRLHLAPRDYGLSGKNVPLESTPALVEQLRSLLDGKPGELMKSALWNGGFYLWRCGVCETLEVGIAKAETLLVRGDAMEKLKQIQGAISKVRQSTND